MLAALVIVSATATIAALPPWLEHAAQSVDVYGRLDSHLSLTDDGPEVENNGSRFGFEIEQPIAAGFEVLGRGEWSLHLAEGDTIYNVSENPDTGLATVNSTTSQPFGTRLGYVGVRFGDYGALTFGKQWGVYYDVSEWVDRFIVFGNHGTSTFNAGTDGGQTGEGRADGALAYRVQLGPASLGVQTQLTRERSPEVDSLSGSVIYDAGIGLRVGLAYSHATLGLSVPVAGYDGKPAQALTGGVTFDDAGLTVSALGTWTHNHELVNTSSSTVMYDTLGADLYLAYRIARMFMPYGGFDFAIPRGLAPRIISTDYGVRDVVGGFRWLFDAKAGSCAYLELRTGQTRGTSGELATKAAMLGIRLNFSLRRSLGLGELRSAFSH